MRTEADNFLNMLRKEIGESIVDRRRQKQITQRELAAMCGISERMLRLVENGERRYGLDIYLLLSAALELPPEALLAESVDRIRQTAEGRERMDKILHTALGLMRKQLEDYRSGQKRVVRAKAVGHRRQDTENKSIINIQKSLAGGGKRAKIYVSMILVCFALRNFALAK